MYALVNKSEYNSDNIVIIESIHRSIEAAEKANDKLQKWVRKNEEKSFCPTMIVKLHRRIKIGDILPRSYEWDDVSKVFRITDKPHSDFAYIVEPINEP